MQLLIKRSLADEKSLSRMIAEVYGIRLTGLQLVNSRENDVYKLYTKSNIYLLKIYPPNQLDESRLEFIERVSLKAYGDNYILRTLVGNLMYSIGYPEGKRVAVLYNFILNSEVKVNHRLYYNYGKDLENAITAYENAISFDRTDATFYTELDKLGFVEPGYNKAVDITACPGTDTCNLGIASSTGIAAELERVIAAESVSYTHLTLPTTPYV